MDRAWHIVSAVTLATLALAGPALAHPGHGFFGGGLAHYLASPAHALPVVLAGVIVGLALMASRKTSLVRGGGVVIGLSALLLLVSLI